VAACSRGDRDASAALLAANPDLRGAIGAEHYAGFYRAAERNDTAALEAMLACGFDPNRGDESIGKTPLHIAAMEGWPDAARVLLAHGASVEARDREFKAQPLIWAAEGSRTSREGRDHAAVGRLLLDAGSPVDWKGSEEPSDAIVEIVNDWRGLSLP
jgi:ankyrin repeat protein